MKVNVEIYGEVETVEATENFWLRIMAALSEAEEHVMEQGFKASARDYKRLHDEIYKQTRHGLLKMEDK